MDALSKKKGSPAKFVADIWIPKIAKRKMQYDLCSE